LEDLGIDGSRGD